MMHNVQVFPLIGLPQFNGWSQVVIAANHSVVLALAIQGQNAGNIGRDLVTQVQNTPIAVAADFYELLQKLLKITEVLAVNFSCAGAFVGESQAAYATYDAKIILKRGAKVGALVTSGPELKLIQGTVTPDDLVVLATNQTQDFHGEIQQKATQGYEAEVIMKSLVTAVHSHPNSAAMSLAFMSFVSAPEAVEPATAQSEVRSRHMEASSTALSSLSSTSPAATNAISTDNTTTPATSGMPATPAVYSQPFSASNLSHSTSASKVGEKIKIGVQKVAAICAKVGRAVIGRLKVFIAEKPWQKINFAAVFVKKNASQPTIYLTQSKPAQIWRILIPLILVVLLLLGGWQWWRLRRLAQVQAAQVSVQPLLENFAVAKEQVAQNPVEARDTMQKILDELAVLQKKYETQPAAKTFLATKMQSVKDQFQEVSGREEFNELPIFFDLSTVQADFLTNEAVGNGSTAVFIDSEKKEAISLDLNNQAMKRWSLSALPAITDAAMSGAKVVFLGQGLRELDSSAETPEVAPLAAEGDSNREAKLLASYTDFIYLLNPVKRNLYRYLRTEKGVSDPIGWLKPGQSLPYEDIVSLKIDGDVWLSTKQGQILKLSLGEMADFTTVGLNQAFSTPILLDTHEDWQNLYILEPQARRLVVLNKNGHFLKEIKSASLASVTHLVVSEAQGKALAVSGSVVFEVKL